jgi:DNA-binding Lrp family transcriptional regulator
MIATPVAQDILKILSKNSRIPVSDIAKMLGISATVVAETITALEEAEVIVRYTTVVNEQKMPQMKRKIRALIEVGIRPERDRGFDDIARRIAQYPNVVAHYLISGAYDFLLIVEGDSLEEISSFVSDKLASTDNVRSTSTHFIMKKYKEKGILIGEQEAPERLAIMP